MGLYWIASTIIGIYNKPKTIEYYPRSHVERYDHRIKAFKKDIRETQTEAINISRKMQTNKDLPQAEQPVPT